MKKKAKLKFEDRIKIQVFLESKTKIKNIAKELKVSKQTIYREIERNAVYKSAKSIFSRKCINDPRKCKYILENHKCADNCTHFIQRQCEMVVRFPFVCNKCDKKSNCVLPHRYYYANDAQKKCRKSLVEPRTGIKISQEDFQQINEIISPLIKEKRQSLNHILTSHDEIKVSERTLRNWINKGYTDARNIDLPRKVSFKPKKEYIYRITKPVNVIFGRTYSDYVSYTKKNLNLLVVQLDTVEGKKSDNKRILTIHFPAIKFQFGILLNSNSPDEVNQKLLALRSRIGNSYFKKIFPIILSDNGIEFNRLYELEANENGELLSKVFYCNPYCSSQKGSCERNHELLRYIEPKYHSMDHLTQDKVNDIFSNINSLYRKSLQGVCAYTLAQTVLGEKFLSEIGIYYVSPDNVNLSQSLTRKK